MEAQRGEASCPPSHSGSRAELGLDLTHGKKSHRPPSWESMEKGSQAQAPPDSPLTTALLVSPTPPSRLLSQVLLPKQDECFRASRLCMLCSPCLQCPSHLHIPTNSPSPFSVQCHLFCEAQAVVDKPCSELPLPPHMSPHLEPLTASELLVPVCSSPVWLLEGQALASKVVNEQMC